MNRITQSFAIALTFAMSSAYGQTRDLLTAARTNDMALAQSLVESKADINQQDDKGYTPLIIATYDDHYEVAEYLLRHGANPEMKDHSGRTALMGAAYKGNEREVKLLLDHGANAGATDSKGLSSMMYAVMFGRISVIKELRASEAARTANQISRVKQ